MRVLNAHTKKTLEKKNETAQKEVVFTYCRAKIVKFFTVERYIESRMKVVLKI